MHFPDPAWLLALPIDEQEAARTRFRLRVAALYSCESGTVRDLSTLIGYDQRTLSMTIHRQKTVPPLVAVKIERIVGRDIMPRENLRPDIFSL